LLEIFTREASGSNQVRYLRADAIDRIRGDDVELLGQQTVELVTMTNGRRAARRISWHQKTPNDIDAADKKRCCSAVRQATR
jgi:hypothetical protein